MPGLILAALAFLAIHFLVSGTRLRDRLVLTIGEGAYLACFSAASLGLLVWMIIAYNDAIADEANIFLWAAPGWWPHAAAGIVLIAFVLAVLGMTSPNPGSVRQEQRAAEAPTGIQRITRHPFLWGVALWAAAHLIANGDLASLVLFGTFLVLALAGPVMIDAKRQRALGATWSRYAAATSNLPFAAIMRGAPWPGLRELGWWRLLLAVAAFAGMFALHGAIFGVSPR
jgi:uncharacterized membrane protein